MSRPAALDSSPDSSRARAVIAGPAVGLRRQVEADLRFDDKTHSKARASLEARGLLFYLAGLSYIHAGSNDDA